MSQVTNHIHENILAIANTVEDANEAGDDSLPDADPLMQAVAYLAASYAWDNGAFYQHPTMPGGIASDYLVGGLQTLDTYLRENEGKGIKEFLGL